MIDWPFIQTRYKHSLTMVSAITPLSQWQVQPLGIKPTKHKTKYGMADLDGWVHINQAFIGTHATHLLDVTLRHEFAHLCVGLAHGHDAVFKNTARRFKADFGADLQKDYDQIHAAIGHKYLLFATLENQQELLFRRVHRRHKKYLNYRAGRFRYLTIDGQKVIRFRYQPIN